MHSVHIEKNPYNDVTGVILAGGKSSRMGRDKAELTLGGVPFFERILVTLQGLFKAVLIAGDRPDLSRPGVPSYPDRYPGSPLGGLYTGLLEAQSAWIFAIACDIPFADPALIRRLLRYRRGHRIVVPRTAGGLEPLFALYHKDCLKSLRERLEGGRFRMDEFIHDFHNPSSVRIVGDAELPPGWEAALRNINTPEDYRDLKTEHGMDLRVRSKVWLEVGREPLLGEGRVALLRAIERTGSISAAARETGLSYRKAWSHLEQMERHLGIPLARRRKGGARGGSTVLTGEALQLIARYEALQEDIRHFADRRFAERFAPQLDGPE